MRNSARDYQWEIWGFGSDLINGDIGDSGDSGVKDKLASADICGREEVPADLANFRRFADA